MSKGIPTLDEVNNFLGEDSLLPVYFLAGKDKFSLENALEQVRNAVDPLIESDFDKEIFSLDKGVDLNSILDSASSFPFGSKKKLIIVRGFENLSEKAKLLPYIISPSDFTVLVITHNAELKSATQQPFKELAAKGYLFADRKLRPSEFAEWTIKQAAKLGLKLSRDNAYMLMDFVGDEKALVEGQLQKFAGFLNGQGEITSEIIENLSSSTKEYSIFELQDALSAGNKKKSLKIILNLLDSGNDILRISAMLSKYIYTLASAIEFKKTNVSEMEAAKKLQVSPYYYKKCVQARYMFNEKRIHNAAKALLNLELAVKTSSIDPKTVATILISEMLQ